MSTDDPSPQKKKRTRNRENELAGRKAAREAAKENRAVSAPTPEESVRLQLELLEKRTRNKPIDADGDINFAYRHMALENVKPLMAPSMSAWEWYRFARNDPDEFLKICAKREDAKAKMAGTITNQRMEDDKRQKFAILDRIEKQLTMDVKGIVKDLMGKFPDDVLHEARKSKEAWESYFERFPL